MKRPHLHSQVVCAELLPRESGLTTGQLVEQIKKLAIAVDPEWARRRYEQALADRKVVGYRNADGSANLSGYNLPLDRVAAASGHIDALTKAAKRAGDTRPLDDIRADLFLGMTDGTYTGLNDAAIIELLTAACVPDTDQTDTNGREGGDEGSSDDGEPDDNGTDIDGGPDDEGPDDGGSDGIGTDGGGSDGGAEAGECGFPASGAPATRPAGVAVGAGLELRVRLSTLLGRDQYPAELAGWGALHAELAATWPLLSVAPSGASRPPTSTGSWSTAGSPRPGPPASPSARWSAGPWWSCRCPPPCCAPWPPTPPHHPAGPT